jgi:uncharacterized phage protein (TIGR02218 family)
LTPSDEFVQKEEGPRKSPAELYHFWQDGGTHWYYTSGDVAISYDGKTYSPATLQRSLVKYNTGLEVSTCTISVAYAEDPVIRFVAINPIEVIWIEISRLHRDILPLETDVVFIGQIKGVSFQGNQAQLECVGFEQFLSMPVPSGRYQITCNWKLFQSRTFAGYTVGCKLTKADFKVSAAIVLDATGRIITSAAFDHDALGNPVEDGYWTLGTVEFGSERRPIVAHVGTSIVMAYRMSELESLDSVDVYPGCDGRPVTCRDKFDNVVNSLWFAFIPQENPTVRTP